MLFVETSYFVLYCSLLLCLPLRDVVCRNKLLSLMLKYAAGGVQDLSLLLLVVVLAVGCC